MVYIKLNQEDFANLKVFLRRVNMNGAEVPAYLNIMRELSNAEICEDDEDIKEVK